MLADYLQSRGDPRGEFIALQLLDARDEAQESRVQELLTSHGDRWMAELGAPISAATFERGFANRAEARFENPADLLPGIAPAWRTLEAIELTCPHEELQTEDAIELSKRLPLLHELAVDFILAWNIHRWRVTRKRFEWLTLKLRRESPGHHASGTPSLDVGFGRRVPGLLEIAQLDAYTQAAILSALVLRIRPSDFERVRVTDEPSGPQRDLAELRRDITDLTSVRQIEVRPGQYAGFDEAPEGSEWITVPVERACICFVPGAARYDHFETTDIGTDPIDGRYGDVSLQRCTSCAQLWLHYLLEFEAFTGSGRYFRGPIDDGLEGRITAIDAIDHLSTMPEHIRGGSAFDRATWSSAALDLSP